MPGGPPLDNFIAYRELYFGTGVSGSTTIPFRAQNLTVKVQGPGGNGGDGGPTFGGGGGSAGGSSEASYVLRDADFGQTINYNVGALSGENSFINGTLEVYGIVSVLCSSGINGANGITGTGGFPGGNGTGGDINYPGEVGTNGDLAGPGGLPGASIIHYAELELPDDGNGGAGGNFPVDLGLSGQTGLVIFEWT